MENEEQKKYSGASTGDNDPVSRLLSGLKRVEAPGDFDFRVRARIAAGRPKRTSSSWLPASVRVAVPLGMFAIVGGYFAFDAYYLPADLSVAPVAEVKPAGFAPAVERPSIQAATTPLNNIVAPGEQARDSSNDVLIKPPVRRTGSSRQPDLRGGGSFDVGSGAGRVISQDGSNPNRKMTVNASDVNGERPFATKDALSSMGVDANYAGLSWTVGGVRQNSPAERSGLKAGDVIEAVNERPLAEKTAFESKFSGKTVRVRRDGKVIRIQLKR